MQRTLATAVEASEVLIPFTSDIPNKFILENSFSKT